MNERSGMRVSVMEVIWTWNQRMKADLNRNDYGAINQLSEWSLERRDSIDHLSIRLKPHVQGEWMKWDK